MITPLLTQLTYEGLVDELIGIKNCMWPRKDTWTDTYIYLSCLAHVELPMSLLSPPAPAATSAPGPSTSPPTSTVPLKKDSKKKHHLTTTTDPLFAELRDLNFSSVGKQLNKVAHRLDDNYKVNPFELYPFSSLIRTYPVRLIFNPRPWPNCVILSANSVASRLSINL